MFWEFKERKYNRFRYYDPSTGGYISQDPIGLAGNNPTLYGYVFDSNIEIDPFGLDCKAQSNIYKGVQEASQILKERGLPRQVRKKYTTIFWFANNQSTISSH